MSEPIRVLELRSVCGAGGGPEKTILMGAARADRRRFEVTVCYIRDSRDLAYSIGDRARRLGVDYVEIVERNSFDRRVWGELRRVVRERGIDIVHGHEYKTDLLALLVARAEGVIPLATAHGWTGHTRRERLFYYPLDKRVVARFPIAIAVSGGIRSELIRRGATPAQVRVVLNGIDHRAFHRDRSREESARAALGLNPSDIVVGSIGRLEPQKRFDVLIRACAALRQRLPALRVVIAGDGSLRDTLAAQAAQMLPPDACRLLGHCDDIVAVHHASDLFVQSSDYEGTSNAVLEAMALETPVVATAAGGTAEIVADNVHGLIVPCGDVAALAGAIEHTLREGEQTMKRVMRARLRVETTLSFDARMTAVEHIYRELVAAHPRRARQRLTERCHDVS